MGILYEDQLEKELKTAKREIRELRKYIVKLERVAEAAKSLINNMEDVGDEGPHAEMLSDVLAALEGKDAIR